MLVGFACVGVFKYARVFVVWVPKVRQEGLHGNLQVLFSIHDRDSSGQESQYVVFLTFFFPILLARTLSLSLSRSLDLSFSRSLARALALSSPRCLPLSLHVGLIYAFCHSLSRSLHMFACVDTRRMHLIGRALSHA